MVMTGQDVVVALVALVGVFVVVRKMSGAIRPSRTSSTTGCPTCGTDDAHCAPAPTAPKSR